MQSAKIECETIINMKNFYFNYRWFKILALFSENGNRKNKAPMTLRQSAEEAKQGVKLNLEASGLFFNYLNCDISVIKFFNEYHNLFVQSMLIINISNNFNLL